MTTLPQTEWQKSMAVEVKRAIEGMPECLVLLPVTHSCSECGNQTVTETIAEPRNVVWVPIRPHWFSTIDHLPVDVLGIEVEYPHRGGAVEFTVDAKLKHQHGYYACTVVP